MSRELPSWVAEYCGLPFKEQGRSREGIDCWGLARLVLLEQLGLETPDYSAAYDDVADKVVIPQVIRAGLEAEWEKVAVPQPFDLIILKVAGNPMHVGLVVSTDSFLHAPEGKLMSLPERFTDRIWKNRIEGFYRHVSRAG